MNDNAVYEHVKQAITHNHDLRLRVSILERPEEPENKGRRSVYWKYHEHELTTYRKELKAAVAKVKRLLRKPKICNEIRMYNAIYASVLLYG